MQRYIWIAPVLLLLQACATTSIDQATHRKAQAERFFRGIYGCDASVVDDLAGDEVVISYPVFEQLFGTPALRGREAVREFATGFCSRWANAQITIHEAVAEGNTVVLLWSFRARHVGTVEQGEPPSEEEEGWGGITLYRFDEAGRIVVEVGEESGPGPAERLAASL